MALQETTNNTPTGKDLEQIFAPARESARIRIAELDDLVQEAGSQAVADIRDPLVQATSGILRALVAPLGSRR
jgi:hypothetical protein